jgi:hypothetical protein
VNRRETRAREYYGYALIAGVQIEQARRMTPGWIVDMFNIRAKYDARLAGAKL